LTSWDLSCPDWEDRIRNRQSLIPALPIWQSEADRAVAIFNLLRLHDVSGNPPLSEGCGDWFRDVVKNLFGSLSPSGTRHIREVFCLVPKKNAKTTYGGLLMLTALLLNKRPNASLVMTAPVNDTAEMAYDAAVGAIELDEVLKKKLRPRNHLKTIEHRQTGATLEIMSFDPRALTGKKPVGVLIDELHVCSKMANADRAIRQLRGGMIPFADSFWFRSQPSQKTGRLEFLRLNWKRQGRFATAKANPRFFQCCMNFRQKSRLMKRGGVTFKTGRWSRRTMAIRFLLIA